VFHATRSFLSLFSGLRFPTRCVRVSFSAGDGLGGFRFPTSALSLYRTILIRTDLVSAPAPAFPIDGCVKHAFTFHEFRRILQFASICVALRLILGVITLINAEWFSHSSFNFNRRSPKSAADPLEIQPSSNRYLAKGRRAARAQLRARGHGLQGWLSHTQITSSVQASGNPQKTVNFLSFAGEIIDISNFIYVMIVTIFSRQNLDQTILVFSDFAFNPSREKKSKSHQIAKSVTIV